MIIVVNEFNKSIGSIRNLRALTREDQTMATTVTNDELLQRLETIERRLDELVRTVRVQSPEPGWLNSIRGILADEPAFAEVIEYGRAFRQSDRPSESDECESSASARWTCGSPPRRCNTISRS